MLNKYLGVSYEELNKMSLYWEREGRVKTWESKERKTEEDIKDFYINMPNEYLANLFLLGENNAKKYFKDIGEIEGLNVLDFGCGAGSIGFEALRRGANVDFYDLGTKGMDFVKYRAEAEAITPSQYNLCADVEALKKEYDIIICCDVLEHVKDSKVMFDLLYSKLKKFGCMVIDTPLILPLFGEWKEEELEGIKDHEHILEAAISWKENKVNDFITKNFSPVTRFLFYKTDICTLLLYNVIPQYPYTTGIYIEKALRRFSRVISGRQLGIGINGEGIEEAIKTHGCNMLFQVDSCGWVKIPEVDILKVAYSIDTFVNTPAQYKKLEPYDIVFYAQKRFVIPDKGFWLPLGVDTDIYKPLNCAKKYDFSFCGTILPSKMHSKRNEFLKEVMKNFCFYVGRDSEKMANLRYNEAQFVFNAGIQNDLNMRVFEGMASGSILVTNKVDDQDLFFNDMEHLIVYESKEDLIKKVGQVIFDPAKMNEIKEKAQKEIKKHTYIKRMEHLIKIVDSLVKK